MGFGQQNIENGGFWINTSERSVRHRLTASSPKRRKNGKGLLRSVSQTTAPQTLSYTQLREMMWLCHSPPPKKSLPRGALWDRARAIIEPKDDRHEGLHQRPAPSDGCLPFFSSILEKKCRRKKGRVKKARTITYLVGIGSNEIRSIRVWVVWCGIRSPVKMTVST